MLFQCTNPDCSINSVYIFESNLPICPKCKEKPPVVATATVVHFVYHDKTAKEKGYRGQKIRVSCGIPAYSSPDSCMTPLPYLVNCLKCKESEGYKRLWHPEPGNIEDLFNNPNLTEEERNMIFGTAVNTLDKNINEIKTGVT